MEKIVRVFRLPEGMTGKQARAWLTPENVQLITGPPFNPEAWKQVQQDNVEIPLDTDPETEYTENTGGNDR